MNTEAMKLERNRAFANPVKARKLARHVKTQAELRQRLRAAILVDYPNFDSIADTLVDVIIEELKK